MKTNKLILNNGIRTALLLFPVIFSTAFAGCSDVAGTAGAHSAVNFQASATGKDAGRNDLTIGPRTYNSETNSFERPWPFGPEANPQ
jgi:hypothetical protein